jgi:hypothetical protein
MTLTTLHVLAATNARIFAGADYKLSQALQILFPRMQVARARVAPPMAPALGVVAWGAAHLSPRRFAPLAAAEEGANR